MLCAACIINPSVYRLQHRHCLELLSAQVSAHQPHICGLCSQTLYTTVEGLQYNLHHCQDKKHISYTSQSVGILTRKSVTSPQERRSEGREYICYEPNIEFSVNNIQYR